MSSPPDIERIEVPKSCDLLAEQLRGKILTGVYPADSPLPAERELVALSGLSRGSVREALRLLEADGLVRTRPGRYGGSVVCRPTDELLARQVAMFAKGRGVTISSLIAAREALEPMLAQLAAQHRTETDLATLEAISARLDEAALTDNDEFLEQNLRWHYAVAVASHNDLLRAFMASLTELIEEATRVKDVVTDEIRVTVARAHRRVLDAIVAQDADAARRRMQRHVSAYSQRVDALLQAGSLPLGRQVLAELPAELSSERSS
ncbi:MAG: FadR/GntR family transcriptional regulator [Burkholderiaceae bacterium]